MSDRFTDVPDSNIFHADIDWLAEAGITKGSNPPDNTEFSPHDPVTRQEMAAFLHRLALAGVVLPESVDVGTRHVLPDDGDNKSDGLSWATAMKSPQAAYEDLVAWADANLGGDRWHVGTVEIGRSQQLIDLGENGLDLHRRYTADFVGKVNTRLQSAKIEGTTMLGSTSTVAEQLVSIPGPTANDNAYGFRFFNLGFQPQSQMTAVIRANDANFTTVRDCFARPLSGILDGHFIVCDGEWDNSWWDISGNRVQSMGLIRTPRSSVTQNQNRWNIFNNQNFFSHPDLAMIDLYHVFDATIIGNNLEGRATGLRAKSSGSMTLTNSGESSSDHPFYHFQGGWWNTIVGGRCQYIGGNDGVFLQQDGGLGTTVVNGQVRKGQPNGDHAKNQIVGSIDEVTLLGAGGVS